MTKLIQEWTREEVLDMVDQRARALLGITGDEFMRRFREGGLTHAPIEAPITVLAALVANGPHP